VSETETETESEERVIELGPLFAAGVLILAYGVVRRRPLAAGLGLAAIWFEQRTELGRTLRASVRAFVEPQ